MIKRKTSLWKRRKPNEKQKLIRQCDDLVREIVLRRDNYTCQYSGKKDNLQISHYITRSNLHLRFNLDNLVTLNAGIHLFLFHKKPYIHREFMVKRIGEDKVKKFEMMDKVKCRPLYECEIRIIKQQLLKQLAGNEIENRINDL